MLGIALVWPTAAALLVLLAVAIVLSRLLLSVVHAGARLLRRLPFVASFRERRAARALKQFRLQREQLEAHFFHRAGSLGKPRGLRWLECDWQNSVTFGRDVDTGMLTAFVGVNIRFEALEGGDMEGVEAVGMVRDAAALFHYHHGRWGTGGRALFNMNPSDALVHFKGQIEPIETA